MGDGVIRTMRFEKLANSGAIATCLLEQFDDGTVYIVGDELGEILVEFAPDCLEKATSQLADLGYVPVRAEDE